MSTHVQSVPTQQSALHDGWRSWGIGLAVGAAMQLFWIGGYITWFLGALCHEMGHWIVGLAFGSPGFPAIRLDGHAVTQLHDPVLALSLLFIAVALTWAWNGRDARLRFVLGIALATVLCIGLLSDTFRDVIVLYAGQGGELVFATIFLWRAYTGGFTTHTVERPLYAALGWLFVWENFMLSTGLMFSSDARALYRSNGSFGGENDLVRVARDHFGTSLQFAAAVLLVLTVLTPLAAWYLGRAWRSETERT